MELDRRAPGGLVGLKHRVTDRLGVGGEGRFGERVSKEVRVDVV